MRQGDLFSGIGGFALAARWMGWRTAWFSEIEPYACRVLAKHWPDVPNVGDITTADWSAVERVDILTGGFPCQDISNAGKRAGIEGERSGLWREFARAVRELRPRWVLVENVATLLGRGYDVVRRDLRDAGYTVARPVVMSASMVGAPHLRERIWILAHAERWHGEAQHQAGVLGEPDREGPATRSVDGCLPGDGQWGVEPAVGRVADGIPRRLDRIRGLGNAIVPQCALVIFRAIAAAEARREAAA